MSILDDRIACPHLRERIKTTREVLPYFKDGMTLGWSGFTPVGYPKAIPKALADHVEKNGLQGKMRFNLLIGASVGTETEDRWASLDMIARRWPYQSGKNIQKGINSGRIRMQDKHLSMFAQDLLYGFYTKDFGGSLDLGIVEASAIKEDGSIILAGSVGIAGEIIHTAKHLIIELNTTIPSYEGLHDIVLPEPPPHRRPHMICKVNDRIGTTYVPCDTDKILAIVESREPDKGRALGATDEISERIAGHILDFFQAEVKAGRLPINLLPLQSGVGNIANAVVGGLVNGPFCNLSVYTEVLQDTMLDFFDSGKLEYASATSLSFSAEGFERFYKKWDDYTRRIVLRPQQIANNPEMIRRLGVIAMNTPVEFDIYAHANSTLVGGTRMINGIGGSGDFLRNAFLSIMHSPSVRPTKSDPTGITCVVPMVPHVDHTEHDLDVLVTEQGLADLRGLCPRDRAQLIINKCSHPAYRPLLQEYLDRATHECLARGAGHEPHLLDRVFRMQQHLATHGSMKIGSWD
ncbi:MULTISPECIES: acetyl-CoA hydrolase/transferase C-terminal domain-containing protein [Syntrophotalea]|uniref:Acetyl-CoA hydrolase n=1 Tax=Syntrophotalea acetylenica TaxID=29542 RepID=A0A1L3GH03_SYNAC|nr:acetyl-CoA hydrolase/transferase C-terminal domain-containing protein [Syntrophotalea acetylenica]APG25221.1 acetyl-CoA hydrolase [Syntrophotalea acetylenica]APG43290.1 acetyl-CoA hydrolase [Syntrophotalea acetylenica]MDY0261495.1 acetyl-CoA hydrolase/transferase C-terminal domain-containing protein [Syntrophotalea acetylenica]